MSRPISLAGVQVRYTEILVEQQPPQGVFVCDHAGLVINKFSHAVLARGGGGAASLRAVRALMSRLISLAGVKWSCLRINKQAFPTLQCLRHEKEAPRPGAPTQFILHPRVDRALLLRAQVLNIY